MNHLWLYMLHDISHSMPQRLQNVIKNKWGMPVTEVLNTCTRKSNKHLLKISCKNKVLIKSFSLWNWIGTNFWDTLYLYDVPGKVFNAVCDLIQFPSRLRSRKTRYIATDHDDAIITCGVLGSWENPLVKKESKTVLDSGLRAVDSGFRIPDTLSVDSGFQSLVGFGIPFGVFRNQVQISRIPNFPSKTSRIPEYVFPYMGRGEFLQSNPLINSRLLFNRTDEPMEMIRNFQGA